MQNNNADTEVMPMLMLMLMLLLMLMIVIVMVMEMVMVMAISIFAVFEWLHARNKFSTRSNCHMSVLSYFLFWVGSFNHDYNDDDDI